MSLSSNTFLGPLFSDVTKGYWKSETLDVVFVYFVLFCFFFPFGGMRTHTTRFFIRIPYLQGAVFIPVCGFGENELCGKFSRHAKEKKLGGTQL